MTDSQGTGSLLASLYDAETLTLGELIEALQTFPPGAEVSYDFVYAQPTTFDSWRGVYAELALGYGPSTFPEKVTVAQLLDLCQAADGHVFEGWKGGDFAMSRETPVWVANPGEVGYTKIIGVGKRYGHAVLITAAHEMESPEDEPFPGYTDAELAKLLHSGEHDSLTAAEFRERFPRRSS